MTVQCAEVRLVAVPGNGEGATPGSRQTSPWGRTLGVFLSAFAAQSGGYRSIETHVVPGQTETAAVLARPAAQRLAAHKAVDIRRFRQWRGGMRSRVQDTISHLREAAVSCPQQQLVLAGYAQGAMALHRALARLQGSPVLERVAAVVLVGDGYRRAGSESVLAGMPVAPVRGQGVATWFGAAQPDVPSGLVPQGVWQVCTKGDVVCDLRRVRFDVAAKTHAAYHTGTAATALQSVARAAWLRTSGVPLPVPLESGVAAQAGTSVDVQLRVRVAADQLPAVRWGDVTGLPPGVQLSDRGRLSGVPTATGDFTVQFTVRNSADAGLDQPVPGEVRVTVARPPTDAAISAGGGQSCQVRGNGTLWCSGENGFGQLGDGTTTGRSRPVKVGTASNWAAVSTSGSITCATRTDGTAYCWGLNRWGQVGDGTRTNRRRPVPVSGGGEWRSVSAGWFGACGIKADDSVWCWGNNEAGQLGDGTLTNRFVPVRVAGGGAWKQLSVGGWHTCGVRKDGSAWCWGRSRLGELAVAGTVTRKAPIRIGTANDWVQVEASWSHTCGLRSDGSVWCWGMNNNGQLGDGTRTVRVGPTKVLGDRRYTAVAVGDSHTCALAAGGSVWCWGYNLYGQLGNGTKTSSRTPVLVTGTSRFAKLDAGWLHSCAVTSGGVTSCWGSNDAGQLGDGTLANRSLPTTELEGALT